MKGTNSSDALISIAKALNTIKTVSSNEDLYYKDELFTKEQKLRDEEITKLLKQYVSSYEKKIKHSKICRYIILIPCVLVICVMTTLIACFSYHIINSTLFNMNEMISFITVCVSFVSLIIGVLIVITKYFFPKNDERFITKIVEIIQNNDLEHKKENAKYKN